MVKKINVIVIDFLLKMCEESTRAILVDYLKYHLDSRGYAWDNDGRQGNITPNRYQAAMRRMCDLFQERFRTRFSVVIERLNITEDNASDIFSEIMVELFQDGVNWGRIVTLFGFSGRFVECCFEKDMPDMVDNVVELVTAYIDNNLRDWMEAHNHWEGFMEFQAPEHVESESKQDDPWPSVRKLLSGIAVAGLGFLTLGAFLTQKH